MGDQRGRTQYPLFLEVSLLGEALASWASVKNDENADDGSLAWHCFGAHQYDSLLFANWMTSSRLFSNPVCRITGAPLLWPIYRGPLTATE